MTAWDDGSGSFEEQLSWANDEIKRLESQLATQTERLRVMREALELAIDAFEKFQPDEGSRYHDVWMEAEQALNQDSLGDGGKRE